MSFLPPEKITKLHFGLVSSLYTLGAQCMSAESTLGEICIPPLPSHSDLGLLSFWLLGGGVPTPSHFLALQAHSGNHFLGAEPCGLIEPH